MLNKYRYEVVMMTGTKVHAGCNCMISQVFMKPMKPVKPNEAVKPMKP